MKEMQSLLLLDWAGKGTNGKSLRFVLKILHDGGRGLVELGFYEKLAIHLEGPGAEGEVRPDPVLTSSAIEIPPLGLAAICPEGEMRRFLGHPSLTRLSRILAYRSTYTIPLCCDGARCTSWGSIGVSYRFSLWNVSSEKYLIQIDRRTPRRKKMSEVESIGGVRITWGLK